MTFAVLRDTNTFFSRFFPPPKFLAMPAFGLSISDDAITALELVREGRQYILGRFGRQALPPGAISGGMIIDAARVASELRSLKDKLKFDFVRASFSEEKAYLYRMRLSEVQLEDVHGALELSLEENVPLPAAEAVFDYAPFYEKEGNGTFSVVVAPRKVADVYIELLRSAGITPLSLCIEAEAITRAVVADGADDTALILNMNAAKTGLFIVDRGTVQFTKTVGVGCANLTEAIGKYLSVAREEAEKIKRGGLLPRGVQEADLFFSCANAISVLKDEVVKLLAYWQTHGSMGGSPARPIKKIILSGADAGFARFDEYLTNMFGMSVAVGNIWQNAFSFDEYLPRIPLIDSFVYAAAVGLALPPRSRDSVS